MDTATMRSSIASGPLARESRNFGRWLARRAVRKALGHFNDQFLEDLGITRYEIEAAVLGTQRQR
jgi:uncharacterized protein YjiS (DUF1127 family)